jgi:hypothetical protein
MTQAQPIERPARRAFTLAEAAALLRDRRAANDDVADVSQSSDLRDRGVVTSRHARSERAGRSSPVMEWE